MLGKLRPVGSRVPAASEDDSCSASFAWETDYQTVFMASGTEALSAAVAVAIARKPVTLHPEILIPAYGCPDLVAAILAQGGKPVLVDLLPGLPFMDDKQLRQRVNDNTVAVVGVGLLGIPERLNVLSAICRDNRMLLIEDSAQCFPPLSSTQPLADCVVLSFGRGKPINLMGGGALLVKKDYAENQALEVVDHYPVNPLPTGLSWRLKRMLFNLLMARIPFYVLEKLPLLKIGETRFKPLGAVSRLNMPRRLLGAAIVEWRSRPLIQGLYRRELAFMERLGWSLLSHREGGENAPLLRYALLAPSREVRDRVCSALNRSGVGASAFYRCSLPAIPGLAELFANVDCPNADEFASRLLTLPCHEDVGTKDVALIASIMRDQGGYKPLG